MKNSIKLLAALAVIGFAGTASAQNTATATGTANATVIAPIAIIANQALDFGNIVSTVAGGTVSETNGTPNYAGDAGSALSTAQAGTIEDATFTVTGQANYTFATSANAVSGLPGRLLCRSRRRDECEPHARRRYQYLPCQWYIDGSCSSSGCQHHRHMD